MYEIAKYLPMSLRRRMAAKVYKYDRQLETRLCKTGRCPMGWLFATPPKGKKFLNAVPGGHTIARRIRKLYPSRAAVKKTPFRDLESIANDFTGDWDDGKIRNLSKALGIPSVIDLNVERKKKK